MLRPDLALVDLGNGGENLGSTPSILAHEVTEAVEKLSFR